MPKSISNQSQLQQKLRKCQALHNLWQTKEFQEYLLPHLKEAVSNQWLDPLSFPSQDEFYRAYLQYRAKAQVYTELINFLASQEQEAENVSKQMNKSEISYKI